MGTKGVMGNKVKINLHTILRYTLFRLVIFTLSRIPRIFIGACHTVEISIISIIGFLELCIILHHLFSLYLQIYMYLQYTDNKKSKDSVLYSSMTALGSFRNLIGERERESILCKIHLIPCD